MVLKLRMNRIMRRILKRFGISKKQLTSRFRNNKTIEYARYEFVLDCYLGEIPAELVAKRLNICKKYHGEILRWAVRSSDWYKELLIKTR